MTLQRVVGTAASALVPLLLVAAVAGCGREDATDERGGLTAERFAEIVVELREAEREALDTDSAATVFARRKGEILERHGVTEAEIHEFAEHAAGDLVGAAGLWEEISRRLRRPVPADSL